MALGEVGKKELTLAQDFGGIEGGVNDGGGRSVFEMASVEEELDHGLFLGSGVVLPIEWAIWFFFAAGVGAGCGHGAAKIPD